MPKPSKDVKAARAELYRGITQPGYLVRKNAKVAKGMRLTVVGGGFVPSLQFVKNAEGTSGKRCPCKCKNGWKGHWQNGNKKNGVVKQWEKKCVVRSCPNDATVGAHVWVLGKAGQHILPFCNDHNQRAVTVALALKPGKVNLAVRAYQKLT